MVPLTPTKTPRWLYPTMAVVGLALVAIVTVATINNDRANEERAAKGGPLPTPPKAALPPGVTKVPPPTADQPPSGTPMDEKFVGVLRNEGIPVPDPAHAVLQARAVCFALRAGQPERDVLDDIRTDFGLTSSQAAFFYGAATYGYCREFNHYG